MKSVNVSHETFVGILSEALIQASVPYTSSHLTSLYQYYTLLLEWNTVHNLTTIVDPHDFCLRHIADSLQLLKTSPSLRTPAAVADIGSGAGFPGIPLALFLPSARFTLVEKVTKKASFLQIAAAKLSLSNVSVFPHRFEDLQYRFDLITARAVKSDALFIESLYPYLTDNGHICLYLSSDQPDPLKPAYSFSFSLGSFNRRLSFFSLRSV